MSTRVEVRAADGTVRGTVELDPSFFEVQPNVPLMHQVVTAQLAAARAGTQSTRTRAEVSGGGAKPFKQKGTGRARQGSTRAPHYSGGGIALGPKPRSYRQRTPRKMVQLALRGALSDRASSGRVAVMEAWDFEVPDTKAAVASLRALGVSGRVLVVLDRGEERAYKSLRNIPELDLVLAGELAAYDVLCSDWLVFTKATLPGNSVWAERPPSPGARDPEGKSAPDGASQDKTAIHARAAAEDQTASQANAVGEEQAPNEERAANEEQAAGQAEVTERPAPAAEDAEGVEA